MVVAPERLNNAFYYSIIALFLLFFALYSLPYHIYTKEEKSADGTANSENWNRGILEVENDLPDYQAEAAVLLPPSRNGKYSLDLECFFTPVLVNCHQLSRRLVKGNQKSAVSVESKPLQTTTAVRPANIHRSKKMKRMF